jgi:hypothetical protein
LYLAYNVIGIIAPRSTGAFEKGSRPPDEEPLVLVLFLFLASRKAGRESVSRGCGKKGFVDFAV